MSYDWLLAINQMAKINPKKALRLFQFQLWSRPMVLTLRNQFSARTCTFRISDSGYFSVSLELRSLFHYRPAKKHPLRPPIRKYLMNGDFFIGASIGSTLAKLALRYISVASDPVAQNKFCAEAMLIIASILNLGKSGKLLTISSTTLRLSSWRMTRSSAHITWIILKTSSLNIIPLPLFMHVFL